MNSLKEKRTSLHLTQPQVAATVRAVDKRIDTSMISRYESGVCLPTDAQISALERLYKSHRADIWSMEDLDLLHLIPEYQSASAAKGEQAEGCASHTAKKDLRGTYFMKKCFRIPRTFAAALPDDLLSVCGYSSGQSWFDACMRRLLGEYAARKKNRKEAGKP